ncbi:MAG: heavy metal sensor histidine kinase [Verrucomicrobia bacterium]|nr:heavy metal sensor histidine kinase [Verrucomicrobiota bacterium]
MKIDLHLLTRRPGSIISRLTLLYVVSTTVLLLGTAGYLDWVVRHNLDAQNHALVASKVRVLRTLLRSPQDQTQVLASEIEHESGEEQPVKYYLRILDGGGGRVLIETKGMSEFVPVDQFPPPVGGSDKPLVSHERELRPSEIFVLAAAEAPLGTPGRGTRILQVALDVSGNAAILANYRRKLLLAHGLGVIFAAGSGALAAWAALRPLARIAEITQRISANRLNERVTAGRWPAELSTLAGEFDAMLDRLQDSFTRLTQFSADLAHALRNPINNLRGEAEVALARVRSPEEYQQILASSLEEYERLSRLIDGLLFIARAEDSRTAIERTRFDSRRELDAVREFYEALAAEHDVTVTCEGEAGLTADPVLFRRAVSNLLANALKHTPAKGCVTLSTRELAGGAVEIGVRDTGEGIAAAHLPRVFDRFFQVGPSRDQTSRGVGLGLAIVQSIMRLHGGTASVESTVGHGTAITLAFPTSTRPASIAKEVIKK